MWPSDLTLAVTLTLNFQGQIWNSLYLGQKWSDCHEKTNKHIDWTLSLKCDHQIWPWLWPWPDLEFSRSNMEFTISWPKMVWLPRNKKQTYRLNSKPQMWPSDLTLAVTLTWPWIFKVKYGIHYILAKNVWIATKQKANILIEIQASNVTIRFDLGCDLDLTLNFQGQIWNLLYLSQKWSNCHETKSKHIDWTLGLKCDHRIWHWPWPWIWIFQGKVWNLLYLRQKWFDCHKMKSTHIDWTEGLNEHQVWPWPWYWKVRCTDLPDSDRRRAVD